MDTLAVVTSALPTSLLTRIARQQAQSVDFATSNVRTSPIPYFIAGGKALETYAIGPLGGVSFNITMLSYVKHLDLGINIDTAAVDDPPLLAKLVDDAFRRLRRARWDDRGPSSLTARQRTPVGRRQARPSWKRRVSSSVGKSKRKPTLSRRPGVARTLVSTSSRPASPSTGPTADSGARNTVGRRSTRPSVFVNSRLVTGLGATALTGPPSRSSWIAW